MIKHEEVKNSIENADGGKVMKAVNGIRLQNAVGKYDYDDIENEIDIIINYITEQEKKDELLELYRECYEEGYFWLEIQQRIKALEEELE